MLAVVIYKASDKPSSRLGLNPGDQVYVVKWPSGIWVTWVALGSSLSNKQTWTSVMLLSDSRFLSRRNQPPLHREQGELWRHRGLQVRVPHVLRHGLLLLPLLRHHDPRAQQQGPARRHPKWVRETPPQRRRPFPFCARLECASPCWPHMRTTCCWKSFSLLVTVLNCHLKHVN